MSLRARPCGRDALGRAGSGGTLLLHTGAGAMIACPREEPARGSRRRVTMTERDYILSSNIGLIDAAIAALRGLQPDEALSPERLHAVGRSLHELRGPLQKAIEASIEASKAAGRTTH